MTDAIAQTCNGEMSCTCDRSCFAPFDPAPGCAKGLIVVYEYLGTRNVVQCPIVDEEKYTLTISAGGEGSCPVMSASGGSGGTSGAGGTSGVGGTSGAGGSGSGGSGGSAGDPSEPFCDGSKGFTSYGSPCYNESRVGQPFSSCTAIGGDAAEYRCDLSTCTWEGMICPKPSCSTPTVGRCDESQGGCVTAICPGP